MNFDFCIVDQKGRVALASISQTSIPLFVKSALLETNKNFSRERSTEGKDFHRHRILEWEVIILIQNNITRRQSILIANGLAAAHMYSEDRIVEIKSLQNRRFKRLVHNIKEYAAQLSQEVYSLIPQRKLRKSSYEETRSVVCEVISEDSHSVADIILSQLQLSKQIANEIELADFSEKNYVPDLELHDARKVVGHALTNFWLLFKEKGIRINMQDGEHMMLFDYRTVAVSLAHLFSNSAKYGRQDSVIDIDFKITTSYSMISFTMDSLRIDPDELDKIRLEGYSGKIPKVTGLQGAGVGLFVVDNLMKINKGTLLINPHGSKESESGLDLYAVNTFILQFPLADK